MPKIHQIPIDNISPEVYIIANVQTQEGSIATIMKISEPLIHELLETTKMYIGIPYNAIFMFVAYDQYRTLHFFEEMIYTQMLGKCGPKVSGLLRDIYSELENTQQD